MKSLIFILILVTLNSVTAYLLLQPMINNHRNQNNQLEIAQPNFQSQFDSLLSTKSEDLSEHKGQWKLSPDRIESCQCDRGSAPLMIKGYANALLIEMIKKTMCPAACKSMVTTNRLENFMEPLDDFIFKKPVLSNADELSNDISSEPEPKYSSENSAADSGIKLEVHIKADIPNLLINALLGRKSTESRLNSANYETEHPRVFRRPFNILETDNFEPIEAKKSEINFVSDKSSFKDFMDFEGIPHKDFKSLFDIFSRKR